MVSGDRAENNLPLPPFSILLVSTLSLLEFPYRVLDSSLSSIFYLFHPP